MSENALNELAKKFNELETSTRDVNWNKGAILSEGSILCENPDCGVEGDNRDHRYGNWVSTNFVDTHPNSLLNYRRQWEVFGYRKDDEAVSRIPQSGRYKLASEKLDEVREQILESFPEGKVTIKDVDKAIKAFTGKAHVSANSGENEWYTPEEFIEAARETMGEIDLDPASSDIANEIVKASTYYTIEDDGLAKDWKGCVWMNPPYAQPWIKEFTNKLRHHCDQGDIEQAIVLVNNATETGWFQNMAGASNASAICFTNKRIKFLDPDGEPGAPLQGQAILYFGENSTEFFNNFGQFGFVVNYVL